MTESREAALLEKVPHQLFIGGQWRDATGGRTLEVYDPATGASIKTIANASVEDAAAAMDAAADTQESWARTAPRVRGRSCVAPSICSRSAPTSSPCS